MVVFRAKVDMREGTEMFLNYGSSFFVAKKKSGKIEVEEKKRARKTCSKRVVDEDEEMVTETETESEEEEERERDSKEKRGRRKLVKNAEL